MKYSFSIPELKCEECATRLNEKLKDNWAISTFDICSHHATLSVETTLSADKIIWYLEQCDIDSCTLLKSHSHILLPLVIAAFSFVLLFTLDKSGIADIFTHILSFYPTFIALGLIGGISCCGALISGLLLALHSAPLSFSANQKKTCIPLFLLGRSIALIAVCSLLALLGNHAISINPMYQSFFSFCFFVLLIFLGSEIAHIIHSDKIITFLHRHIVAYQKNQKHLYSFVFLGISSVLLPCEFSALAELFSLQSASFSSGLAIGVFFAIGNSLGLFLFTQAFFATHQLFRQYLSQVVGGFLIGGACFALFELLFL